MQASVGFWDPLGFTADGNVASFKWPRPVELKHSRICMMASMGYRTPELTGRWPGFLPPFTGLEFADIPNDSGAISKVPALGGAQMVASLALLQQKGRLFKENRPACCCNRRWQFSNEGDHRHVLPSRDHKFRLGRLGTVHRFVATSFRERVRLAGP